MSTHTSRAFVAFICDMLNYTLPRYGIKFGEVPDELYFGRFDANFGEAVVLFRERHATEFKERMFEFSNMETSEDFLGYTLSFCRQTFKGNTPLMELMVFCAFLLDMAIYSYRTNHVEPFGDVINETIQVFQKYVASYFSIVGGWWALYEVGRQYLGYVYLSTKQNSVASTTAVGFDAKV